MWPYILSAGAITLLSLVLNLVVIPAANGERLKFELNYIKNIKGAKYDPHIYRQIEPGTFAYIRDYTEQTRTAAFFVLETYENGTIVSSLEAANAKFDPETGRWSAPKSVYRKFEDDKEIFNNTQALDTLINLNTSELGRVEELVKTMDIVTLGHFIQQQRAKGSDMIARFEVERHNRVRLSGLDIYPDDHRRVAVVAQSARRNRASHRHRHRAGVLVHLVQQVRRRVC